MEAPAIDDAQARREEKRRARKARKAREEFREIFRDHFEYGWTNLRRLGVPEAEVETATVELMEDVFKRMLDNIPENKPQEWIFGMAMDTARKHGRPLTDAEKKETIRVESRATQNTHDLQLHRQAAQFIDGFMRSLDEQMRAAFILSELLQQTIPEIAPAIGCPVAKASAAVKNSRARFESIFMESRKKQGKATEGMTAIEDREALLERSRSAYPPHKGARNQGWGALVTKYPDLDLELAAQLSDDTDEEMSPELKKKLMIGAIVAIVILVALSLK